MSDIESGLKEAVERARQFTHADSDTPVVRSPHRRYGRTGDVAYAGARVGNSPLTAPQVISAIETLTKQAWEIHTSAAELAGLLAGSGSSLGPENRPEPQPDTIFDRMGLEVLQLTRVLELIKQEVDRSLGSVRP